ncbi:GNAT family N-acetyltransferase [Alcaligenes sp. WGS1538]|uniref:GNAT family N-acetyltransferase n=1 Tax=Alcaligenes sp. WGS1538 TaxID=3366811 RepID=UPI00372D61B5
MSLSESVRFSLLTRLDDLSARDWDELAGGHVFVRHAFLLALQHSECASARSGWEANFLLMHRDAQLCGAVPLYLKHHSRGEYVFDQGWAQAYHRHGLAYYPKLLSAVPFTPVGGPRLLARTPLDKLLLARQLQQLAQDNQLSSVHVLFPTPEDRQALEQAGFMIRHDVQFHWRNEGYEGYDDFLAALTQQKRKKLRQDSRKIAEQGIEFEHRHGDQLRARDLDYFYQCYANTYLERGQTPYLTREFFERLREQMPDSLVLILAHRQGRNVASALSLRDGQSLYGRYWGCTQYVPGLHFETCYTQAIKYCIAQQLQRFEGGAQGEHKLSRGLLPTPTCSAHWIADPRFAQAVQAFLDEEAGHVARYRDALAAHAPFKAGEPPA